MIVFRWRDYLSLTGILSARWLMSRTPRWSPERLERWSRARRRAIVMHAWKHVPFYREALTSRGIRPELCDRPEEWQRIPTIDKAAVRENLDTLMAPGRFRFGAMWSGTSGSTGMPLQFLVDQRANTATFAMLWRAWGSGGFWHIGQRQASLKGFDNERGWRYNRAIRTLELSSVRLNAESVRLYRSLIQHYRPRFLRGYTSSLYLFCRLLRDHGLSLHVPMVIAGSEMVHPFQRAEIEAVLGARVFNHYTHWERAGSILECEHGRMHSQEDYGHIELLDERGDPVPPGVQGEIVTTGLHNLAMPLIRYRTGDIAVWSSKTCPCGQPFPLVGAIHGRRGDLIVSADGVPVSATAALVEVKYLPVKFFQVIQCELGAVELRLVPGEDFNEGEHVPRAIEALRRKLGAGLIVNVVVCGLAGLERTPAGKTRICFNRLPAEMRPPEFAELPADEV